MLRLIRTFPLASAAVRDGSPTPLLTIAREFSDPRLELMRLLHEACAIEHALMVQYLYAAFSLKFEHADLAGTPDPTRSDCLLGVAVQEMLHFREVNHMLVRFGGQPNMTRQDFPYESHIYPFEMKLERLTRASLAKYVYAEAPAGALKEAELSEEDDKRFARAVLNELREEARFNHIGTLYKCVLGLFDELSADARPSDLDAMRTTILRIKDEGEGGHFQFFKRMFLGTIGSLRNFPNPWADPDDARYPSFPVPDNPTALLGHDRQITDPRLLALAQLGNLHYWIVLSLLHLSYMSEADSGLARLAVGHMTGALYPLSQEMARAHAGMPFDPLSLGYYQGTGDGTRSYVRLLLEAARQHARQLAGSDPNLAGQCLQVAENSLRELTELGAAALPADVVAIIGAGPAGLAAACALAAKGVPVCLLEQASLVGGKVHSFRREGHSIEHGVHGWWTGYLNFNRLLEEAGVRLADALKEAEGTNLVQVEAGGGGRIYKLRNFRINVPSPLHLILQTLRAPYLRPMDTLRFLRFGIHLLAFRHERDYHRYDPISFQQLMNDQRVPQRIQHLILQPFILSFDFAVPEKISAACGLSGSQFYVLPDQKAILTRWSRGLPQEKVFGPIVSHLKRCGGRLLLNSPVRSVTIADGAVRGLVYQAQSTDSIPPAAQTEVLAELPAAQASVGAHVPVVSPSGHYWVTRRNGGYEALSARCTHQGCNVDWVQSDNEFRCPCHGGRYDAGGQVLQGPPVAPLAKVETRLQGDMLQLLGASQAASIVCPDVILATDTHAAQQLLRDSPGVGPALVANVEQLDTTPVIVVRLWFDSDTTIPENVESAITPDAEFIDNFFSLNCFSPTYDQEGKILEVQSYRVDQWLDRSDEEILAVALRDLATFCPGAVRERLTAHIINRHRALFTEYAPGKAKFRPGVESGVEGLYLAGDWTEADWSVWMMERAVVSGLRAANAVLSRRGLGQITIRRLPNEGLLLRFSRRLCEVLRDRLWKSYP